MVNKIPIEGKTHNQGIKVQKPAIVAGGCAGFAVAAIYYPVDTLKTRLQAPQGFVKAGGFRGIYKGCLTLLAGSIPTNSFFFGTYETSKSYFEPRVAPHYIPLVYTSCASCCRVVTCMFRVPIEVAVQRQQVYLGSQPINAISVLLDAYRKEGVRHGVYRGFGSVLMRDMPYSLVELPTWEMLKATVRRRNNGQLTVFQSAGCGVCASAFAACLTTPFDVVKTRVILTRHEKGTTYDSLRIRSVFAQVYKQHGIRGLFAGMTPRLVGVSGGRFFFFVVYEKVRNMLTSI